MAKPDFPSATPLQHFTADIANSASLSEAVDLGGTTLVGIQMPATWTTATLTIQAAADGATYVDVYDATGTELEIAAAASTFIGLDPAVMAPFSHVKIRSGTTGTPVNQGGDRELILVGRLI